MTYNLTRLITEILKSQDYKGEKLISENIKIHLKPGTVRPLATTEPTAL